MRALGISNIIMAEHGEFFSKLIKVKLFGKYGVNLLTVN